MNFLQLCQRLRREVGGSGDGPPSVLNQQGENRLYVEWINQAWQEIQNYRTDWGFHWTVLSQPVAEGSSIVSLPADLRTLSGDTLHIDGYGITVIPWAQMQQLRRQTLNTGRPTGCSMAPNGQLYLNATPDTDYTLFGEYYAKPQELAENDDVPLLPSHYHMLIVYKAMMLYAGYENAPDVFAAGQLHYQQMLADLEQDQLPSMTMPGAIA
jgi:hypothetical protein